MKFQSERISFVFLICVILWQHRSSYDTDAKRIRFRTSPELMDVEMNVSISDILFQKSAATLKKCSLMCFSHDNCSSFSFNSQQLTCSVFMTEVDLNGIIYANPCPGIISFVKTIENVATVEETTTEGQTVPITTTTSSVLTTNLTPTFLTPSLDVNIPIYTSTSTSPKSSSYSTTYSNNTSDL